MLRDKVRKITFSTDFDGANAKVVKQISDFSVRYAPFSTDFSVLTIAVKEARLSMLNRGSFSRLKAFPIMQKESS